MENGKEFTLCLLFDNTLEKVLLLKKDRGIYNGQYNGVGGKVEIEDKSAEDGAYREIYEETGLEKGDISRFEFLMTCIFPSSNTVHVYFGVLKSGKDFTQKESEELRWFPVESCLDVTDTKLAGDGQIPHFIVSALYELTHEVSRGR